LNKSLKSLNLPALETTGNDFFYCNPNVKHGKLK